MYYMAAISGDLDLLHVSSIVLHTCGVTCGSRFTTFNKICRVSCLWIQWQEKRLIISIAEKYRVDDSDMYYQVLKQFSSTRLWQVNFTHFSMPQFVYIIIYLKETRSLLSLCPLDRCWLMSNRCLLMFLSDVGNVFTSVIEVSNCCWPRSVGLLWNHVAGWKLLNYTDCANRLPIYPWNLHWVNNKSQKVAYAFWIHILHMYFV